MVAPSALLNQRDHPGLGIATFVGNLVAMALISAAVRTLVEREYPLAEVLLFRYLAASAFFLIILFSTSGLAGLASRRPLDHAIRSISGVVSLALLYFAITRIPLADATAIAYAAPIFITLLSIFLLGESIGLRRWLAVLIGFIGVLLIAQPTGGKWDIGVIAAGMSAFTGAIVVIWLRKLSSSEKSATIGSYYNSLGTIVCVAWVLASGWLAPRGQDWILLEVGITVNKGTKAYRLERQHLTLKTENETVALATQKEFLEANGLPALNQRAKVQSDSINYFPVEVIRAVPLNFFAQLGGGRRSTARDSVELSSNRVAMGRVFFNVPGGIKTGQYWLNIQFEGSKIEVPFRVFTKEENKDFTKNWQDYKKAHEASWGKK